MRKSLKGIIDQQKKGNQLAARQNELTEKLIDKAQPMLFIS